MAGDRHGHVTQVRRRVTHLWATADLGESAETAEEGRGPPYPSRTEMSRVHTANSSPIDFLNELQRRCKIDTGFQP